MTDANNSNLSLFQALMNATVPAIAKSGSKYSLGIVNSRNNGKRLTISKSIADNLELTDKVYAMPAVDDRKLVLSRTQVFPNSVELTLSGEGKKISYSARFVLLLTDMFGLDFSEHVSRTFTDITFDEYEGVPVAVISFP